MCIEEKIMLDEEEDFYLKCFKEANSNGVFNENDLAILYGFIVVKVKKLLFVENNQAVANQVKASLQEQASKKNLPEHNIADYIDQLINKEAKCEHGENFAECYKLALQELKKNRLHNPDKKISFHFCPKCRVNIGLYIHSIYKKKFWQPLPLTTEGNSRSQKRLKDAEDVRKWQVISFSEEALETLETYGEKWKEEEAENTKFYIKKIVRHKFVKYFHTNDANDRAISLEDAFPSDENSKMEVERNRRIPPNDNNENELDKIIRREYLKNLKEYMISNWYPIVVYYWRLKNYSSQEIKEKIALSEIEQNNCYKKIIEENPQLQGNIELSQIKNKIKKNRLQALITYLRIVEKIQCKKIEQELDVSERAQRNYVHEEIEKIEKI